MNGVTPQDLAQHFPTTELARIGDEIADGLDVPEYEGLLPLSLFDGCAPTSAWQGWRIMPARGPTISSATCCSPIPPLCG
jgi:hypothetical protein